VGDPETGGLERLLAETRVGREDVVRTAVVRGDPIEHQREPLADGIDVVCSDFHVPGEGNRLDYLAFSAKILTYWNARCTNGRMTDDWYT